MPASAAWRSRGSAAPSTSTRRRPSAADVLGKLADSTDVRARSTQFNPQAPGYKALKAELAAVRSGKERRAASRSPRRSRENKAKSKKGRHRQEAAKAPDVTSKAAKSRHHHRQHGALALDAARSRRDLCDGQHPRLHAEGRAGRQDRVADQDRRRQARRARHAAADRDDEIHHRQPDLERAAVDHPQRVSAGAGAGPERAGARRAEVSHNPDGSIRIYQPPGEKNALGRIRFNFPNRFLVYQHDTPDKNLFDKIDARLQPRLHAGAEPGPVRRGAAGRLAARGQLHRRSASVRCTARTSAPSTSSTRSRSISPIRPRSSTTPASRRAAPTSTASTSDMLNILHGDRRTCRHADRRATTIRAASR